MAAILIYTVSQKKIETVKLEIVWINFDDIWPIYSEDCRIKFACFSFHVGLLISRCRLSNCMPKITRVCCALSVSYFLAALETQIFVNNP